MTSAAFRHHFAGLFQFAYVTNDIERAKAVFAEQYGVRQFLTLPEPIASEVYREGRRVTNVLKLAFAGVDHNQIELIEPVDDGSGIYAEVLPESGFALVFHHVACRHRERAEWDAFRAGLDEQRHPIAIENAAGPASFLYLDERKTLGHYLEYMWLDPASAAMFASIPNN
ncbi:MAG TPA: VOC family protein [Porticoccaceae bacterium]|nr:VOC family protein [Porticoccaceae bacterium]